ncbi:major facilitator superfamily domain-containing protein [Mycena pura]|uniref:Major facilitator superfamily domain-containing protein n=1 Tax=Mycena pura TaxID=153505 RepID=A0AAD6VQ11_9AGAR|nr:major facilitator superfamily domain-containing protein [Mycena pura]
MSASRSRSRQSVSRHAPVSYAQSVLPDGAVDEETVELFGELVHPHRAREETLVDDDEEARRRLPWWKRPSPWWLLVCTPLSTIAMSATQAPKVEVYTLLVCSVHKPEIFKHSVPNSLASPYIGRTTFPASFEIAAGSPVSACASDPVVQAAVAKLNTGAFAITTSMGVLGCLTTGWWGSFSDRYGRTRILGLTILGLLFNDFIFIFVTKNFRWLPGGYWFLLVGPILEGVLGGFASAGAASHAYFADVTRPSERSRIFSLFFGLVFTGVGIGPTLGGLIVKFTGNLLSVFYLATAIHGSYAILSWTVLPESLATTRMQSARVQYAESLRLLLEQEHTLAFRIQRLFTFLKPLTIFFPEKDPSANPLKGRKRDWNLTLLAAAYGFTLSIMGSLSFKYQYLMKTFGWTSENVGYYLTIAGATRAVHLAILLPLLIKLAQSISKRRSQGESEPLLRRSSQHSASFDLWLARISLVVDAVAYTTMPLAPNGIAFTVSTVMSSFGSGFMPAVQTVAMALYSKKHGANAESGKLFGALSVLQTLGGQILGPSVYGLVYMNTVGSFPKAIFLVSIGSIAVSFICVSLVRLPSEIETDSEAASL